MPKFSQFSQSDLIFFLSSTFNKLVYSQYFVLFDLDKIVFSLHSLILSTNKEESNWVSQSVFSKYNIYQLNPHFMSSESETAQISQWELLYLALKKST